MRMPFGVRRPVRQSFGFITPDVEPLPPTVRQQIQLLSAPRTVSRAALEAYASCEKTRASQRGAAPGEASAAAVPEKIKAQVSVLEFVSQYVDLKVVGSGALGLCPFHDDHRPSFGVNDEGNYWHCFAGCGGGSVIDFWMKWRGGDFTLAVRELAQMLL